MEYILNIWNIIWNYIHEIYVHIFVQYIVEYILNIWNIIRYNVKICEIYIHTICVHMRTCTYNVYTYMVIYIVYLHVTSKI